jgi:hypothetical protein
MYEKEQEEEKINYRSIFKKKIVIYSIASIKFPMGIELKKIIIGVISFLFALLVHFVFLKHLMFFGNSFVNSMYYVVVVVFSIIFFSRDYTWLDGKTAYRFIFDYIRFLFQQKIPKHKIFNDKVSHEIEDKVKISVR